MTERPEPVELMARALRAAGRDSGAGAGGHLLLERAQSLRVVVPLSWRYVNPGVLVSERLGIAPRELALTVIGGNTPQTVVNHTALQIAAGDLDVALVTGAECIYTRLAARRDPERPVLGWTTQDDHTPRPVMLGTDRVPVTDAESARGLDRPLRVFPMFENALRFGAGESIEEHQRTDLGPVGPLLVCGDDEPLRMVSPSTERAGRALDGTVQPDGVVPLPEADERQRPRRPGRRTHPVFGGRSTRRGGARRPMGVSRRRSRCPRPLVPLAPTGPAIVACHPDRREPRPGAGRSRDRRRRPRGPVLVLPLRRADRRARAGPSPSTTPAGR